MCPHVLKVSVSETGHVILDTWTTREIVDMQIKPVIKELVSALKYVSCDCNEPYDNFVVTCFSQEGSTPLSNAAEAGNIAAVDALVAAGADVNERVEEAGLLCCWRRTRGMAKLSRACFGREQTWTNTVHMAGRLFGWQRKMGMVKSSSVCLMLGLTWRRQTWPYATHGGSIPWPY
jgi:hypothetical protein